MDNNFDYEGKFIHFASTCSSITIISLNVDGFINFVKVLLDLLHLRMKIDFKFFPVNIDSNTIRHPNVSLHIILFMQFFPEASAAT